MSSPEGPALVVQGGPFDGREVAVRGPEGQKLLGSGPKADFQLAAANVEGEHALLRWNDQGVLIEDLSKEHGTFLNGERVEQAVEIGHGDRVCLGPPGDAGSVKLLVRLPGPPSDYPAEQAKEPPSEPTSGPGEDAVAAVESGEWGAVDDDDQVMSAEGEEPKPARGGPPPTRPAELAQAGPARGAGEVPPPARPAEPAKARPAKAAPRERVLTARRPRPRVERPSFPRALMVGAGAALLCGAVYLAYSRTLAPAPVLLALLPPKAEAGQTIQINGSGFFSDPATNVVTFADKPAQVIAAGETQLSVVVPQGLPPGDKPQHRVRVSARGKLSNMLFFRVYIAPKVSSFDPDVAMPGDEVQALGENFGEDTAVVVGGKPAQVLQAEEKRLRFRVPELSVPQGQALPVGVQVGKNAARLANLLIGKLPLVLEVAPVRGLPGDRVTIKGRGFDPAVGGSVVSFGDRQALVLGASESELSVIVPGAGTLAGPRQVGLAVRARGSASTGTLSFTVTRASAVVFLPRFFPEPGPDPETVVVASELGPFLRLRGKAEAPSAAERAARVAAGLNAAMEQASRGPVTVELRERPEPAVALAGAPQPIVVATAADGQAYEQVRPAARALARYWTALLQDYLALFAQRQRPFRVLELSPRGQALLELYVAAERRAGDAAGVPSSIVEALSGTQARALAEMAMNVPAQAPVASGAAVSGRWDGTLEEDGRAPRAIQVRLRTAAGELQGSLAARAGTISAELPLADAGYKNGTLSFVVTLGASPLRFSGKVDGRAILGQVQSIDGKPVGRFSLRWVE